MLSAIPTYITLELRRNHRARQHFERLAPSYRRAYVGWIDSAKRSETKEKHLREAIEMLAAGKKLGLSRQAGRAPSGGAGTRLIRDRAKDAKSGDRALVGQGAQWPCWRAQANGPSFLKPLTSSMKA